MTANYIHRSPGLAALVVTHDLGLAWNIADRLAVMYLGRIVEVGTPERVFADLRHPYTKALMSVRRRPQGVAERCVGERLPALPADGAELTLVSCHLAAARLAESCRL